jgi:hypothetical protein
MAPRRTARRSRVVAAGNLVEYLEGEGGRGEEEGQAEGDEEREGWALREGSGKGGKDGRWYAELELIVISIARMASSAVALIIPPPPTPPPPPTCPYTNPSYPSPSSFLCFYLLLSPPR